MVVEVGLAGAGFMAAAVLCDPHLKGSVGPSPLLTGRGLRGRTTLREKVEPCAFTEFCTGCVLQRLALSSHLVAFMKPLPMSAGVVGRLSPVARMQEDGGGGGPGRAGPCCLVLGLNQAASDSFISAGCKKHTVATVSSGYAFTAQQSGSSRLLVPPFCACIVALYGIDEEDGIFHPRILLGGTMEASSQNSISNFASKIIAALESCNNLSRPYQYNWLARAMLPSW